MQDSRIAITQPSSAITWGIYLSAGSICATSFISQCFPQLFSIGSTKLNNILDWIFNRENPTVDAILESESGRELLDRNIDTRVLQATNKILLRNVFKKNMVNLNVQADIISIIKDLPVIYFNNQYPSDDERINRYVVKKENNVLFQEGTFISLCNIAMCLQDCSFPPNETKKTKYPMIKSLLSAALHCNLAVILSSLCLDSYVAYKNDITYTTKQMENVKLKFAGMNATMKLLSELDNIFDLFE